MKSDWDDLSRILGWCYVANAEELIDVAEYMRENGHTKRPGDRGFHPEVPR